MRRVKRGVKKCQVNASSMIAIFVAHLSFHRRTACSRVVVEAGLTSCFLLVLNSLARFTKDPKIRSLLQFFFDCMSVFIGMFLQSLAHGSCNDSALELLLWLSGTSFLLLGASHLSLTVFIALEKEEALEFTICFALIAWFVGSAFWPSKSLLWLLVHFTVRHSSDASGLVEDHRSFAWSFSKAVCLPCKSQRLTVFPIRLQAYSNLRHSLKVRNPLTWQASFHSPASLLVFLAPPDISQLCWRNRFFMSTVAPTYVLPLFKDSRR